MTLVTVIIPARNEETALAAALTSVLVQTFPAESLEVIVVDGASTDRTTTVAEELLAGSPLHRWAVLNNTVSTTPSNLNLGLRWANGDIVVRVDARSVLPSDYIERTVDVLSDTATAAVGGRQAARPVLQTFAARSIARALNNPFANGGARYRDHRAQSGPCDTAYLGVFRAAELQALGGWAEEFTSNQDFELSRRAAQLGTVWYEADLPVAYQPRSTFQALFQQYRRFGRWKAVYWRSTRDRPQPRQWVLLFLPALGLTAAGAIVVTAPAHVLPLAAVGVAALGAVDHVGAEDNGTITERVGSCVAMAIIGFGWWTGAAQHWFSKQTNSKPATKPTHSLAGKPNMPMAR